MQNLFIARYDVDGVKRTVAFDKSRFNEDSASAYLKKNNIQNFLFFFEPYEPTPFGDNGILFKGDVGFDITLETLQPHLDAGKEIIFDSFGGDLWEGLKMHDAISLMKVKPTIGVLGSCASAATLPILATPNSWITDNSRFLVHNPWTMAMGDDADLAKVALDLKQEKENIAAMYAKHTGREVGEMIELMSEEKFLTAKEAVDYGFIKSIKNNSETKNETEMKETDEELKNRVSAMEKITNKLKNIFAPPKNIVVQDVNGVEIDFYEAETEEQIVEGAVANVDGVPAEGDYEREGVGTYKFAEGKLTEIVPVEEEEDGEEMAQLKEENEQLSAQVTELKNSVAAITAERDTAVQSNSEAETLLGTLQEEITSIKSSFSDEKPKPNVPGGDENKKPKFTYKSKKNK